MSPARQLFSTAVLVLLTAALAPAQELTSRFETGPAATVPSLLALTAEDAHMEVSEVHPLVQPAGLHVADVPLTEALTKLRRSAGVPLAFSPSLLPERSVSCECELATVRVALDQLLAGTLFRYVEVAGQVLIERVSASDRAEMLRALEALEPTVERPAADEGAAATFPRLIGQEGTITGQVTAASTLKPLVGAQVSVLGTGIGGLTNDDGRYRLTGVPTGQVTVRAQMIGYGTEEKTVTVGAGETAAANFELTEQAIALNAIVVTGTAGPTRRREIGNSISVIDAGDLETQVIRQAQDAIAAQVPGLLVMGNAGVAGAGGTIRIRGISSVTQGNQPLIYVDGVRIFSQALPGTVQGQSVSPLNAINPNNIARIEVIKGASATTLYGTEASGGVIQIFTKDGVGIGKPRWNASITQGIDVMGQIGPEPGQEWFDKFGPESRGLWMDQWLRTGWSQAYNLSVRGSGEGDYGVSYFLSGRWKKDQGVYPQQGTTIWNLRGNVGFQPLENLHIQFTNSITSKDILWINGGWLAKSFPLNVMRGPHDYTNENDEVFFTEFDTEESINHFIGGIAVRFSPSTNFYAKLNLGLDYVDSDYRQTEIYGSLLEPTGARDVRRWRSITRTIDLKATYERKIMGIATATSAGFQVFDNELLTVAGSAENFSGPSNPTLDIGAQQSVDEDRLREVNAGVFIQEKLGFDDKLFITAGLRIDGNSAFGEDYGLQPYPKLAASYIISDEAFWPDVLEMTKLRAAYGTSGKAPGYFDAQRTWAPITGQEGLPGVTPVTRGNPNLGPERTWEIEAGIEMSAFDSRLTLDASIYRRETTGALLPVPQDPTRGFLPRQIRNVGTIRGEGFEVSLTGIPLQSDEFTWDLGFVASIQRSIMADLGGSPPFFVGSSLAPGLYVREGYPVPSYFGPKLLNADEIGAPEVEEAFFGPVYPTRIFVLSSTAYIGERWIIDVRGEYQGGHYLMSHTAWRNNQRKVWPPCFDIYQRIEAGELNQLTAAQRYQCNPEEAPFGAYISPADFFRLRSVAVTYDVPESWLGTFGQWTVSIGAQNLFTATDYIGLDPEATQDGANTLARWEYYQLPMPRTFTLSITTAF